MRDLEAGAVPADNTDKSSVDVDLAIRLAEIDMQSLYAEHIQMWDTFANAVRLMLLVISLPILSSGLLISAKAIDLSDVTNLRHLPYIVVYITLGSGVLGILILLVVIHYRLDVLLYARAINSFRGFYVAKLHEDSQNSRFSTLHPDMPTTSDVPKYFEPLREVGILVLGFACVNATYLTLAALNLSGGAINAIPSFWQIILIVGIGVAMVTIQYIAYYLLTLRRPIAGFSHLAPATNGKKKS